MHTSGSELRMYQMIFEHCPQALLVIDDDGRVLIGNQRARALPGLDALFRSHDPDVHAFRAKLRVGWKAYGEVCIAGGDGVVRPLALEGRSHGTFSVVTVREPRA